MCSFTNLYWQVHGDNEHETEGGEDQEKMVAMPKKANNPILNKK